MTVQAIATKKGQRIPALIELSPSTTKSIEQRNKLFSTFDRIPTTAHFHPELCPQNATVVQNLTPHSKSALGGKCTMLSHGLF